VACGEKRFGHRIPDSAVPASDEDSSWSAHSHQAYAQVRDLTWTYYDDAPVDYQPACFA